jgi:hypothetical protein
MSLCKSTIPSENYDPDTILKAQFQELRENDEALLNFVKNTFSEYCGELKHINEIPNMETIKKYMEILNKIDDGEKLESDEIAGLKEISKLVKKFLPIFKANLKNNENIMTDSQQAIIISTFVQTAKFPMKGFEVKDLTKVPSNVPSYASQTTSSALKIKPGKPAQTGGEPVTITMSVVSILIIAYKFVETVNQLKTTKKYEANGKTDDKTDDKTDIVEISNIEVVSDEKALETTKTIFEKTLKTLKDLPEDTKSAWNAGKMNFMWTWLKEIAKALPEVIIYIFQIGGKKSRRQRKSKRRQRKSKRRR